jgi:Zn-dependent protease
VYIVREAGTDWQNLLISLAGPLSNFVASYVSLAVFHRGATFCAMNLVIGIINLLPLPCSDGLRAYKLLGRMASLTLSSGPDSAGSSGEQQER